MPTVFHPDHVSLDKLFTTETRFIIPEYQRPYSWQSLGKSDNNNQINQMWDDLWSFFQDSSKDAKEYFLGSMVIIEPALRCYEVVDGQQRLTSLTLLFAAMRMFLQQQLDRQDDNKPEGDLLNFVQRGLNKLQEITFNEEGIGLVPTLKVKIKRAAGNGCDYNDILNRAVRGESVDYIANLEPTYHAIARRYFANRDYFLRRMEECFLPQGQFGDEQAKLFNKFFAFLQTRVAIVTIKTQDFDTAFNIFEILNNRGLPLTNKDLLRNFIISKFSSIENEDGAGHWERLEEDYALTGDFIGRFVESNSGKQQRSSAFNDLKTRYENHYRDLPGTPRIVAFYEELKRNLGYYTLISDPDGRTSDIHLATRIKFINQLGNARYSTNLMMALFRHHDVTGLQHTPAAVLDFLRAYQQHALYILLAKGRRYSSKNVYEAIRLLLSGNPDDAVHKFALSKPERDELATLIGGPVDNTTGRTLIAGYIWHQECVAGEDVVEQRLNFDRTSLEHIIPQRPSKSSHWISDFSKPFRDQYTYRLGNMTLLTTRKNASASRKPFADKQKVYRKTQLALTQELTGVETITPEFIEHRHQRIVAGLCEELGLTP